jgi:hypothetical protein
VCEARKVLADGETRKIGPDRVELAANARGGGGLHVEGVEMAGAAELMEEDDRAGAGGSVGRGDIVGAQEGRQARQEGAEGSDAEEAAARE